MQFDIQIIFVFIDENIFFNLKCSNPFAIYACSDLFFDANMQHGQMVIKIVIYLLVSFYSIVNAGKYLTIKVAVVLFFVLRCVALVLLMCF